MLKSTVHAQAQLNTARGFAMAAWTPRLALFIGDPLAGGVEVAGGGYARQNVVFAAPVGNLMQNSAAITFPTPTGTWGSPTHMALMDAMTGGAPRVAFLLPGDDTDRLQQVGSTPISLPPGAVVYQET